MAKASSLLLLLIFVVSRASVVGSHGSKLSPKYYKSTCPEALSIVGARVEATVKQEPRIGASLLRLHFHDCFVNGCDGSILLDDNSTFTGEKPQLRTRTRLGDLMWLTTLKLNSRKLAPESFPAPIFWPLLLGEGTRTTASKNAARRLIPAPNFNISALVFGFRAQGLSLKDLVALSGAHTIGLARCTSFRARIYDDSNINPLFAKSLQHRCRKTGKDNVHRSLDLWTPTSFDNFYFQNLLKNKGLLHSDQELVNGASTNSLVKNYAADSSRFFKQFSKSMIKMGNIKPLTGNSGEIRIDCRKAN
ncbi:protein CURVATURE THYLAKOID 1D [Hibiscus syriacus]|uniref:Peroxidase n=1 Tax=Hibiscus syriacus TaxID=106335 RepID=A0A6A3B7X0_HIBSY|nr:protein CURVATURE THYLAKOID 1D [Hibiscus syriacus]